MSNLTPLELALFQRYQAGGIQAVAKLVAEHERAAFYAGFDAGQDGGIKAWAYEAWCGQT